MSDHRHHYGLDEVSRLAGVHYKTVWYYLATKRLPAGERVGRTLVFTRQEADDIVAFFSSSRPRQPRHRPGDEPLRTAIKSGR